MHNVLPVFPPLRQSVRLAVAVTYWASSWCARNSCPREKLDQTVERHFRNRSKIKGSIKKYNVYLV